MSPSSSCWARLASAPNHFHLALWPRRACSARHPAIILKAKRLPSKKFTGRDGAHFASVDTGVAGYKAWHNLAVICQEQGRPAEAEAQWRAALAEQPSFLPAWAGLADSLLAQRRWNELEQVAGKLGEHAGEGPREAILLRGRVHLARKEFAAARQVFEAAVGQYPEEIRPRVLLTHALLQEGGDWPAAEAALREVLAREPGNAEAAHNLRLLVERHGSKRSA